MYLVWKCEYCSYTDDSIDRLKEHENKCTFNPSMKSCYTCVHFFDSGYNFTVPDCKIELSTLDGIDDGNCKGWYGISDPNSIEPDPNSIEP